MTYHSICYIIRITDALSTLLIEEDFMVSIFTILALCFSFLACFAFPIVLCILFMRKTKPGIVPLLLGIAVFIIFVLVLEQGMHFALLVAIPGTKALFENNVWLYATYGAFAAGIFEECGRWLVFSLFMKKKREWKHGITYGIGHGGIEAVLLASLAVLNNLIYAIMINTGSFDTVMNSVPQATADILRQTRDALLSEASWLFTLTGVERICAITFQIALSVLVLYAVSRKKYQFVGLAILLHAAIDFPAVLYQKGILPLWSVEVYCVVLAIPALIFILKSKKLFPVTPEGPKGPEAPKGPAAPEGPEALETKAAKEEPEVPAAPVVPAILETPGSNITQV